MRVRAGGSTREEEGCAGSARELWEMCGRDGRAREVALLLHNPCLLSLSACQHNGPWWWPPPPNELINNIEHVDRPTRPSSTSQPTNLWPAVAADADALVRRRPYYALCRAGSIPVLAYCPVGWA